MVDATETGEGGRGVVVRRKKRRRKKRVRLNDSQGEETRGTLVTELEAKPSEPPLSPEFEAALVDKDISSRRQYARFVVGGKTRGRVTAVCDAVILNISVGGSLIEHSNVVRPGTISLLDLDLLGKRLSLKCRVARSVVARTETQPDGERELIFHTGLEFLGLSDETRKVISHYIQSIICDGKGADDIPAVEFSVAPPPPASEESCPSPVSLPE